MLLDGVKLTSPPSPGGITIAGPSFRYSEPAGAPINDMLTLEISDENRRQRGTSVIVVDVHAR
ncbi:hypothetical protein [Bradyrhizobium sp. BR 10261]|uniref:hypothetical protein n=1 Tax=Bradyrhizobium sp. BR 10261 TaxID=2749992 RepID=UPI001C6537C1|nr:hypothetical protein [Bradyrhizobium sp. BR 10261]MBW7961783.1 hypothetical protein [Bradyrhizobium sp. BR 10261]